jgi:hypothetical protein
MMKYLRLAHIRAHPRHPRNPYSTVVHPAHLRSFIRG